MLLQAFVSLLEHGTAQWDLLCSNVVFEDYAIYAQREKEDTVQSRAWCRHTKTMVNDALCQATPFRHLLTKATWYELDQCRAKHFAHMSTLFGTNSGATQGALYAEMLKAYIQAAHSVFVEIAETITSLTAGSNTCAQFTEEEIAIFKDMPNKFLWLYNTDLTAKAGLELDTPLPLLTPILVTQLVEMLHSKQNAFGEVRFFS